MMYAVIVAIGLANVSQLGAAGRYQDQSPDTPAATKASAAADGGLAGKITVGANSPQPELPDPAQETASALPAASPPMRSASEAAPSAVPQRPAAPLANAPAVVVAPKTSDLMREWNKAPLSGQLSGVPISLAQALRGATTRQQQTDRTTDYWDLAAKVTQYYLVLRETTELAALKQGVTAPGPQWLEKQRALDAEKDLARSSAESAQLRFHQLLGHSSSTPLPLPADLPHCGQYETQYSKIFAGRTDPAAKQLNDLLPLKYAELRNQAQLVAEAYDWLKQVSQTRDPNSDGVGLLRAHELVSLRRRALVDAVCDYNQDIAAYTELAAPRDVGADRLVAMLIRVSTPTPAAQGASGVQQASANEEAPPESSVLKKSNGASGATQQQADNGQWRQVRRPLLDRLRNREHSILVPRLQRLRRGN
jgi:hypothetical protein